MANSPQFGRILRNGAAVTPQVPKPAPAILHNYMILPERAENNPITASFVIDGQIPISISK